MHKTAPADGLSLYFAPATPLHLVCTLLLLLLHTDTVMPIQRSLISSHRLARTLRVLNRGPTRLPPLQRASPTPEELQAASAEDLTARLAVETEQPQSTPTQPELPATVATPDTNLAPATCLTFEEAEKENIAPRVRPTLTFLPI